MELSEQLRCLFSATVEPRGDSYVIEVPEGEIDLGTVDTDETYRIALVPASTTPEDGDRTANTVSDPDPSREENAPSQPVEEGERRTVEIEDIGDQGDGLTRVERGFVVIVPDTDRGERVRVEITDVRENVAFADVVERISYYD